MAPWSPMTIRGASLVLLTALGCPLLAEDFDSRTGVPLRTEVSPTMFPTSWRGGDVQALAHALSPSEALRSRTCVESALGLYPVALVRKNLKSVYLLRDMSFYGVPYGGTNSVDAVYLSNQGVRLGFTDSYLRGAFHHEFSSILLRNYSDLFNESEWKSANRPGATYGQGGVEAIKNGSADLSYRAKYNVDGFLSQYGTASVEEDFNTYAESLFGGDRTFWVLVDRYPRIERKKNLMVAFYQSLDGQFTEAFFRDLAK